jgi:hypothetical protein
VCTEASACVEESLCDEQEDKCAAVCPDTPAEGCRRAKRSLLLVMDRAFDADDKFAWKWLDGESTAPAEFGDPVNSTEYALCLYAAGDLMAEYSVRPSRRWKGLGNKGFRYSDRNGRESGIKRILFKGSRSNRSKVVVVGKGARLPDMPLGNLPAPLAMQLANSSTGICWESQYGPAQVTKNRADFLKARAR